MATENTHGGKRKRAGRTTELGRTVTTQRTNLSLDPLTLRMARALGGEEKSLSRVVREAIRAAYEKYQASP